MPKTETIKVVARIRPLNEREKKMLAEEATDPDFEQEAFIPFMIDGEQGDPDQTGTHRKVTLYTKYPATNTYSYAFDSIQWMVDQNTMFEYVGLPLCKKCLGDGVNGTIFAYGQTGSGKTYTMFGRETHGETNIDPSAASGLIPRCVSFIFSWMSNNKTIRNPKAFVSVYECYVHDSIRDLLNEGNDLQRIELPGRGVLLFDKTVARQEFNAELARAREAKTRNRYLITQKECTSLETVLHYFLKAQRHRTVRATPMNPVSSRGHCIMLFEIAYEDKNGIKRSSRITFADLAGCERLKKTGVSKEIILEARSINSSLSVLGRVITCLATGHGMVPFKDSALSHALKDSLSGHCRTTLVVAASPHLDNILETISSFNFAKRCKMIKTKTEKPIYLTRNQMKKEIQRLRNYIVELKKEKSRQRNDDVGIIVKYPNKPSPDSEDERKGLEKEYEGRVEKLIMKDGGTDVQWGIEIADVGEESLEVKIKFVEDEDNSLEKCTALRDRVYKLILNSPDWQDEDWDVQKQDPINEMFVAELQAQIREKDQIIEDQKGEIFQLREDLIQFQNVKHKEEEVSARMKLSRMPSAIFGDLDVSSASMDDQVDMFMQKIGALLKHGSQALENPAYQDSSLFEVMQQFHEKLGEAQTLVDGLNEERKALEDRVESLEDYEYIGPAMSPGIGRHRSSSLADFDADELPTSGKRFVAGSLSEDAKRDPTQLNKAAADRAFNDLQSDIKLRHQRDVVSMVDADMQALIDSEMIYLAHQASLYQQESIEDMDGIGSDGSGSEMESMESIPSEYLTARPELPTRDYGLVLGEFNESELRGLGTLATMATNENDLQSDALILTFCEFLSMFPDIAADVAVKVFSCLEDGESNFISVNELKNFIRAAKLADPSKRTMEDISGDAQYDSESQHRLGIKNAKNILAQFRECQPSQIRHKDIGMEYLAGLTGVACDRLFHSCPPNAASHFKNFSPFELLYVKIEENHVRDHIMLHDLLEALHDCGVNIEEEELRMALQTVNVDDSRPFPYDRVLNLLLHPASGLDELCEKIIPYCNMAGDASATSPRLGKGVFERYRRGQRPSLTNRQLTSISGDLEESLQNNFNVPQECMQDIIEHVWDVYSAKDVAKIVAGNVEKDGDFLREFNLSVKRKMAQNGENDDMFRKISTSRVSVMGTSSLLQATQILTSQMGTISIRVIAGHNLQAMDSDGLSDPYIKLKYNGTKRKTPCHKNTLNPRWENTIYEFKVYKMDSALTIECWDWNQIARNVPMGDLVFTAAGIAKLDQRRQKFKLNNTDRGELELDIAFIPNEMKGHSLKDMWKDAVGERKDITMFGFEGLLHRIQIKMPMAKMRHVFNIFDLEESGEITFVTIRLHLYNAGHDDLRQLILDYAGVEKFLRVENDSFPDVNGVYILDTSFRGDRPCYSREDKGCILWYDVDGWLISSDLRADAQVFAQTLSPEFCPNKISNSATWEFCNRKRGRIRIERTQFDDEPVAMKAGRGRSIWNSESNIESPRSDMKIEFADPDPARSFHAMQGISEYPSKSADL